MSTSITEASYPLRFREDEAKQLGEYLRQRQSVGLVGMRRVGISNFLRFFLYHKDVVKTYISQTQSHLFIPVDLNDLVEREIYPFWTLTLKRISDACEKSSLPDDTKKKISSLFLHSIQSQELFLLMDNIRRALTLIVESGNYPTFFFLRFDRLQDAFNPSFFDNLAGLRDGTNERLSYVFTSYRSLDTLFPPAKTQLSVFAQQMYIKPAKEIDMRVIYEAYRNRYNFTLSEITEKALFELVNGNIQYLQLALIILNEKKVENIDTQKKLLELLTSDERITLESEELWESLTKEEQKALIEVFKKHHIPEASRAKNDYLWDTGLVVDSNGDGQKVFSPLLEDYLRHIEIKETNENREVVHLTKKEHLLFKLLESQLGEICEREKIIEVVWPEYKDFGVSDWAIDRLVARVRGKLREQDSPYEIVTVRTRGYKLSTVKE